MAPAYLWIWGAQNIFGTIKVITLAPEHLLSRARIVDAGDNPTCGPPSAQMCRYDSTRGDPIPNGETTYGLLSSNVESPSGHTGGVFFTEHESSISKHIASGQVGCRSRLTASPNAGKIRIILIHITDAYCGDCTSFVGQGRNHTIYPPMRKDRPSPPTGGGRFS
jgi:hypothetical protein